MTEAEKRALEVDCPACGAGRGRACRHLGRPSPHPWLPDREWLAAMRALELRRPHRRRVDEFRELVLHREDDHSRAPYSLTRASCLRVGLVVYVAKWQRNDGRIIVPRRIKAVYRLPDDTVWAVFIGPIWPLSERFAPYMTVRTALV